MTRRISHSFLTLGVALALAAMHGGFAIAQPGDGYLAPMDGPPREGRRPKAVEQRPEAEQWSPTPRGDGDVTREALPVPVEQGDLAPVMAGDGSGLPMELWRGLDAAAFERLIGGLEIPPRSPALHAMWKRLIASDAAPPSGAGGNFTAVRLEVLYQSGLAEDADRELAKLQPANDAVLSALAARNELALTRTDKACELVGQAVTLKGQIPKWLKGQTLLLSGYCAAVAGDAAGAGLAAEIAREEGIEPSPGLDALDALSIGAKAKLTPGKQLTLIDYRLAEKAGSAPAKAALESGEPALLVALSNDPSTPADLGLLAAEAAAKLNALTPETLAAIYRVNATAEGADALLSGSKSQGPLRRAALLKAIETEQTPMKKTRLIRALLDDAKRNGMSFQALQMIAPAAGAIVAGKYQDARRWVAMSPQPGALSHWLALADIADPSYAQRGQDLAALEPLAVSGRFQGDALHRLATVLDALLYQVPIPLWDAANRTPQPAGGYLPETGVLTELQDAAKKKEFGRTVLLAMKALGPNGAEGAHMIALGDSIRALKRAGLEADARRLGLEALFLAWPRTSGG